MRRFDPGPRLQFPSKIKSEFFGMPEALQSHVPAKRFGKPAEIASAVTFLASDKSAFCVGSEFIIDIGLSL